MLVRLQTWWWSVRDSDRGATMPEYALVVTLIAVAAFAATSDVGTAVAERFTDIAGKIF